MSTFTPFGTMLRKWRARRRMSQLELALEAGVSARHLAFLETGRANPSRAMVAQLMATLDVPVQARNDVLLAAGFAPQHTALPLEAVSLAPLRGGLDRLLERHAPYPGLLFDRHFSIVKANRTAQLMLDLIGGGEPVTNLLDGLAESPRTPELIENWPQLAAEFAARLKAEAVQAGDAGIMERLDAFLSSVPPSDCAPDQGTGQQPFLCVNFRVPNGPRLSLFSVIGQFGPTTDATVADLRVELFFPADAATGAALQAL
jgi:transcriptional regulator with XRE-family HTH domain